MVQRQEGRPGLLPDRRVGKRSRFRLVLIFPRSCASNRSGAADILAQGRPAVKRGLFDDEAVAAQAAEIGGAILTRLTDERTPPTSCVGWTLARPSGVSLCRPDRGGASPGPEDRVCGHKGFWLLLLATPFRGRAIPCGFLTYSSKTIASQPGGKWKRYSGLNGRFPSVSGRLLSAWLSLAIVHPLVSTHV